VSDVAACRVEGLSVSYDGVLVLDAVSLQVLPGQVLAVIGTNGSGKSTLLRCMAGHEEPSAGRLWVVGERVRLGVSNPHLTVTADAPALAGERTAWEHAAGLPSDAFAELLTGFGIADRADEPIEQLSRGTRQKVALALALCRPADLLLIDEPFSGLDAAGRAAFLRQLERVRESGAAAIVATHAVNRVHEFADQVLDLGSDDPSEA
jgi:ABC-2 type transport system ATP-binding protein